MRPDLDALVRRRDALSKQAEARRTAVDPQMPEWLPGIAARVIHAGESDLMQRMLDAGEDISDFELWRQRRAQFLGLLADRAAER